MTSHLSFSDLSSSTGVIPESIQLFESENPPSLTTATFREELYLFLDFSYLTGETPGRDTLLLLVERPKLSGPILEGLPPFGVIWHAQLGRAMHSLRAITRGESRELCAIKLT